ncbi:MAG TPA: T9SS type A sorting domain-containing protein [Chitinophagales bacterium]|nr:T9SS type A sorting domain-containing protein [Chitinophagales bacterium]
MNKFLFRAKLTGILCFLISIILSFSSTAQTATNSVFVNFGRQSCNDSYWGSDLTLFADAQSTSPDLLLQCNTTDAIGHVFAKFVGYNALNNKLYINDISDGVNSKIFILNMNLPSNLTCPAIALSYTIPNVILSQFEFDNLGDLYALTNYNAAAGTANIGAYDDTTGLLQPGSLKSLSFPSGHFPADIQNGDVTFTPNGRMFAMFGGDTSKLFEIKNYQKTSAGNATTTFLGTPTKICYGIAYDNGHLLMGGTDLGGSCWSFTFDLITNILSAEIPSPFNSMPIDATAFSPSIAVGEKLISAVQVDATHYALTYNIYLKNLGNVKLGKVQVTEDLATVFGAANISNVSTSWKSNAAQLDLDTSYNGNNKKNLLSGLVLMNNYKVAKTTSTIILKVTVANAIVAQVYKVSAKFSGKIGKDSTLVTVLDSSNNYSSEFTSWIDVIDPNRNNVADDPGEGIPTPWLIGQLMPIELSAFDVHAENTGASLTWTTPSEEKESYFAIERSNDAILFDSMGIVPGSGVSTVQHDYSFFDTKLPKSTVYYRLKQTNSDGSFTYSEIRVLELQTDVAEVVANYLVYPNPASSYLVFESSEISKSDLNLDIYSLCGASIFNMSIPGENLRAQIALPQLPNGFYIVAVKNPAYATRFFKISINN